MEQPDAAVAGIILAAGVLLFCYVILFTFSHRKKLPPEAGGAWPVIGHLHHLLNSKEPTHITLAKMADAYGPIFTFKLGLKKTLIVSNWEIAKEFFTTNDKTFASRPKLVASKLLAYNYAMMGFSPYTPHWRHVRKIATLELLTSHRLEQLRHVRVLEVERWMKRLYEFWGSNYKSDEKLLVGVEMKEWLGDVTLDIIFKMVIGKRFVDIVNNYEGGEDLKKGLMDFFGLFGVFIPSDSFPFLKWFDLGGHEKAMKNTAKIIDKMFGKFLEEHREKRNNFGDHLEINKELQEDFMDVMISAVNDEQQQHFSHDADTVIKATCLNMILGGFDTTTITMTWAISLLLNNKDKLKKVQLELDEQIGRKTQVKEEDIKKLTYLQAVVKETLRLYPAAPLSVPHESMEPCNINYYSAGYHIPKGTCLIVNLQKLQRDPLVWDNPCQFHPERFLTTHKGFEVRGQSPQFIPFGNGRRMCPGISFALQIMHLALANFLHGFMIQTPFHDQLVDMEESIGLTSMKKLPLQLLITPRLSPQLYESN